MVPGQEETSLNHKEATDLRASQDLSVPQCRDEEAGSQLPASHPTQEATPVAGKKVVGVAGGF